MDRLRDPFVSIVLVLLIGILCGWLAHKFLRRSWLAVRVAGRERGLLTHLLVGIAGAFISFHAAMLTTASTINPLVPFAGTAVISALVLWGWRIAKF